MTTNEDDYPRCPECGCYANIDWATDPKAGLTVGPVCEEYPDCADLMEPPA